MHLDLFYQYRSHVPVPFAEFGLSKLILRVFLSTDCW